MKHTITCKKCGRSYTYDARPSEGNRKLCANCVPASLKAVRSTDSYILDAPITVECAICGTVFTYIKHSTTGRLRTICDGCRRELNVQHQIEYQVRNGICKHPGVGSGNAQGTGKTHHSYKNGDGIYRRLARAVLSPDKWKCELCGATQSNNRKDPNKPLPLCVHHKDGDHLNNDPSNWMILCKRCHQIIHNCAGNLPQNAEVKLRKKSGNSSSGQSDLKATVTSSQGQRLESDA